MPTGLKIDLLMRKETDYDREAFARRRRFRIDVDIDPFVKTVEDSVLKKLQWYQDGGRSSSTQWRDVVELLRVNASRLDRGYLGTWSAKLGVETDLTAAFEEAARPKEDR